MPTATAKRPHLRKDKAYVLRLAKEHDVRFIRLWFTDILGFLKSFAITIGELEKALEEGMGFDGSSIEGFARIDESDMLAFSAILAAGLEGLEKAYDLPAPTEENAASLSEAERNRRGITTLPGSLGEAIECAEGSAVLRRALGEHVFASFLKNKKIEWDRFCRTLTDYELKTYLPLL